MKQSKRQQAVIDIINKMFEIAGHEVTFEDVLPRKDNWFLEYTITEEKEREWIEWSIDYLRKKLKMSKESARREMMWMALSFGLKIQKDEISKD
ncbi:hypothetical protein UFOVP425_8 [uncultured Caudovirales phage]|uniref:Uncharacterized protein n=1 Tax=uncultured Caudovirales phage TaxID=2100421 RepID=A0A6J5M5J7_9CAUD|nr:hypothetical protein UFOVP425_8 [uncultured Caudovirales phage]